MQCASSNEYSDIYILCTLNYRMEIEGRREWVEIRNTTGKLNIHYPFIATMYTKYVAIVTKNLSSTTQYNSRRTQKYYIL